MTTAMQTTSAGEGRGRGYAVVAVAYLAALGTAAGTLVALPPEWHPLLRVATTALVATVTVFFFSWRSNNTALFNPYWSLSPIAAAAWLALGPGASRGLDLRQAVVLGLVTLYGVRLTYNWLRGWPGLRHEDWQYVDYRVKAGAAFWPVSLGLFHLFPAAMVTLGLLPLHAALVDGLTPVGPLDALAWLVTLTAIVIEWLADDQLRAFRLAQRQDGRHCEVGLWRWSRHPNYFGECLFWTGLFLCGQAAGAPWWSAAGFLVMLALFLGISVPMAEQRSRARRPGYAAYAQRTSLFVPLPPGRAAR